MSNLLFEIKAGVGRVLKMNHSPVCQVNDDMLKEKYVLTRDGWVDIFSANGKRKNSLPILMCREDLIAQFRKLHPEIINKFEATV